MKSQALSLHVILALRDCFPPLLFLFSSTSFPFPPSPLFLLFISFASSHPPLILLLFFYPLPFSPPRILLLFFLSYTPPAPAPITHHPTARVYSLIITISLYLSLYRPPVSSSLKFCNRSIAYVAPALLFLLLYSSFTFFNIGSIYSTAD